MSNDLTKVQIAGQLWLTYFNKTLFEQGTISEMEYKKMMVKIRSHACGRRKNRS